MIARATRIRGAVRITAITSRAWRAGRRSPGAGGADPQTLPPDHPAWALEADYIALALANTICVLSPQRIILGGGVMEQRFLFPMIRERVRTLLNGYIVHDAILTRIDEYIVPPALGGQAGVLGAVALARDFC